MNKIQMVFFVLWSVVVNGFIIGQNKVEIESDNQSMYLVMAYIDFETRLIDERAPENAKEYIKILFRLEGDSLAIIDTLNAVDGLKMDMFLNNYEEGVLFFSESDIHTYDVGEYFSVFDYKDSLILRRHKIFGDSLTWVWRFFYSLNIGDTLVFNAFRKFNDSFDGAIEYGFDKAFNLKLIKPEDFRNFIQPGTPSMQQNAPYPFQLFYLWENYDSLRIFRTNVEGARKLKDVSAYPTADIQLPDSLKGEKNDQFNILVNNARYCVGILAGGVRKDSLFYAYIFDKRSEKWSVFTHSGPRSRVMNWEDWLYGTVILKKKEEPGDSAFSPFNKDNRYDLTYGIPGYFDYDYPGVLFLYNISTGQYLEWETGDPDSEIILIHQGKIYYRVFDELRVVNLYTERREIDWSTSKLVVKDRRIIPNVHWIFFAPPMKLKEIWIDPSEKIK